jgi:NADH:ubiquinone oxidoreductase subunit F (NADH-binding)
MHEQIIDKIKDAGLLGRGGASFPTYKKWEAVKNAKGNTKYIVCNASEGELQTFKDKYILEHHTKDVIQGIKIALDFFNAKEAYIYLKHDYWEPLKPILEKAIGDLPIKLFQKSGGYIAGEETTLLNCIEGNILQPRFKPPYPTEVGLWGCPTLINNVETFWAISQIAIDKYENDRFFSIAGDVKHQGVYKMKENDTVEDILKETKNYPNKDFFVQIGGGSSGSVLLPKELNTIINGIGSIVVYDKAKTNLFDLTFTWADFFHSENCDKCVPCREGLTRAYDLLKTKRVTLDELNDIFFTMEQTSFCALGKVASRPFKDVFTKLL